jgi:hypothetical protein
MLLTCNKIKTINSNTVCKKTYVYERPTLFYVVLSQQKLIKIQKLHGKMPAYKLVKLYSQIHN